MKAESIAKALGGRRVGNAWMVRCPAHDDHDPSLSIQNADGGKVLVHCHSGCDQARVIAALRSRGLWGDNGHRQGCLTRQPERYANNQPDRGDNRLTYVMTIWQSATAACGTPVETYLRSRGITIPPPASLRFHVGLKHPSGKVWPAMIALVTRGRDDTPLAIHRTFLNNNGTG